MSDTKIPFKAQFGAFILETLTFGMYGESKNAIREYIQNAFDSLRQAIAEGVITQEDSRVDVTLDTPGRRLVIRDNGTGLHVANAVDVLASVGASNKTFRKNAGFRGIGRLAGIVFCDTLVFSTKARGDSQRTVVTFDAKVLRERLSPESPVVGDAASTLESCVEAHLEDAADVEDHYFEVQLNGFHNPPIECEDINSLRSFISQVSPLPYAPEFPFAGAITDKAHEAGFEVECVRVYVRAEGEEFKELFKPYREKYSVKQVLVPLEVSYYRSATGRWWGWVGQSKVSGAFKGTDTRGIRVRVRNIQIDGTEVFRDIFAVSHVQGKSRTSYARFADWYVGEIFVDAKAAIPNARRDGFEEDDNWETLRNELDVVVATPLGRAAYRTSNAEQLSVEKLTARVDQLKADAAAATAQAKPDWESLAPLVAEATEVQRRITVATKAADEQETQALTALTKIVADAKRTMNASAARPLGTDCAHEVALAESRLIQRIYKALRDNLDPTAWNRSSSVIERLTGEAPKVG